MKDTHDADGVWALAANASGQQQMSLLTAAMLCEPAQRQLCH